MSSLSSSLPIDRRGVLLPFTEKESLDLGQASAIEELSAIHKSYSGRYIYDIVRTSAIADPRVRLEELKRISKVTYTPRRVEPNRWSYDSYSACEWLRDPSTRVHFGPGYRSRYLRVEGPPSFEKLTNGEIGVTYQGQPQRVFNEEARNKEHVNGSRYLSMIQGGALSICNRLKEIVQYLVLKTLEDEPKSLDEIEEIRTLFVRMSEVARIMINGLTVQFVDGFPIFRFMIEGLQFNTLPGGYIDIQYNDIECLVSKVDFEAQRYGRAYLETDPRYINYHSRENDAEPLINSERLLWWLMNHPIGKLARYRDIGLTDDLFDTRSIDNLPELIWRAGLTQSVDSDSTALITYLEGLDRGAPLDQRRYNGEASSFSSSERALPELVIYKGRYIRERIREWLATRPDIPIRSQPVELPDRLEYCLSEIALQQLPPDLAIWFEKRVWFVPNPYTLIADSYIQRIAGYRFDELATLESEFIAFDVGSEAALLSVDASDADVGSEDDSKSPEPRSSQRYNALSLRERLYIIDLDLSKPNEWVELTRHCNTLAIMKIYEEDDDSLNGAKFAYYYASRGFRHNIRGSLDIFEIYSGNRNQKEINGLRRLLRDPATDYATMATMIRYPYPWRATYDELVEYIETGEAPPITSEIEAEAVRYRFYETMTTEQHRQASSLYNNDPETEMVQSDYTTRGANDPKVALLDPIALDLSRKEVFDDAVRRLGVVFPLGSSTEAKRAYLIDGLFIYKRLLSRPSYIEVKALTIFYLTDAEIISRLGCYPLWTSAETLRPKAHRLFDGEVDFFIPVEVKCRNARSVVGLDSMSELEADRRFIIAFGTVDSARNDIACSDGAVVDGAHVAVRSVAVRSGVELSSYVCYTLYDLAAGFRPSGVHSDILQYAVLNPNGTYRQLDDEQVATLVGIVQSVMPLLHETDRTDAQAMLTNIAYLKRQLVKRTDRDRGALGTFKDLTSDSLNVREPKESIRIYLERLFEYGMYLRRWRGPSFAYPMRASETLCTQFDMNSDLLAPTGRLQEAYSSLGSKGKSFVDSLPMKHYISGSYSESSSITITDLIYQLNRQDDGNMCIRMGSTKVIGSAVYYLEMLFDTQVENFNIDKLDHIQ